MTVIELETTIGSGEASIGAEMRERRHQSLIDVERRKLVQLFEKVSSLRHYLRQERNDLRGALTHERAELRAAQKHRLRLFGCICIRDIVAVGSESLAPESLTSSGDDGDEAAADFDLVAEHNVSVENDEDTVCRSAALVQLESRGPGGSRAIRAYRSNFF